MTITDRHSREFDKNLYFWQRKALLRRVYRDFHEIIAEALPDHPAGYLVELGSGVPDIKEVVPDCLRTDISPNPWVDRVENAYKLSFADASISALILFDVFHHLRYPGTAFEEFSRVLLPAGRVLIFEPCVSLLGLLVYGLLHKEPLALKQPIQWHAPSQWSPGKFNFYAAQGNATRVFLKREVDISEMGWRIVTTRRLSAVSYVLSGGYSKPQMYPDRIYPFIRYIDRMCDRFPKLFATRLLVVLEKNANTEKTTAPSP